MESLLPSCTCAHQRAAEQLTRLYPKYVRATHHGKNKGYGAALQTGLRAVAKKQRSRWLQGFARPAWSTRAIRSG